MSKKSERVVVRMSSFTRRILEAAADARERNLSEFMREASLKEARFVLGAEIEEVTDACQGEDEPK